MTEEQQRFVANHEAGHYILDKTLFCEEDTVVLSIEPMEGAYGIHRISRSFEYEKQRQYFVKEVAILLGGIAATEIYYKGFESYGSHDDLKKAKSIAKEIALNFNYKYRIFKGLMRRITMYEMVKNPSLCRWLDIDINKRYLNRFEEYIWHHDYQKILKEAYKLAKKILLESSEEFLIVREELVKRKKLTGKQLIELLKGKT